MLYIFACVIKLLQHNLVKMMTWAVDSAISGVRITLSWWWRSSPSSSRSSSWEWRGWCEKGVWAVVHFVRKQSCARWRSCRGRKIQSRQNTRRTKQRGLGHFFLAYYLLVSRHITEPNDLKQFLSLINLSSPRPCCQFDDCLTEACWQHFVFIFLFWLGKIRLRCDVAVLHLGIFWPIFHFKGCVFSCPGQLNSDSDLDWTAFAILAMFVFLRGNCFFIGVSGSSENWTNIFSQGSKFLVHGAHWCKIKHVF